MKDRFTFEVQFQELSSGMHNVSVPRLPSVTIQEKVNDKGEYSLGDHVWQPITIVYKNTDSNHEATRKLYAVLAKMYKLEENKLTKASSEGVIDLEKVYAIGILTKYDSTTNTPLSEWLLRKLYISSINFGYLDYNSNSEIDVKTTWHFGECEFKKFTK